MNLPRIVCPALAVVFSWAASATASAQSVVGIGTAQAGATLQFGTAVAKVVSERSGIQMRTQALSSTNQYAPRVNDGELEFGFSNIIETTFARRGEGLFEGRPAPNLRMAFTMFPLPVAFLTSKKSGITEAKQFPTARTPIAFNAQKLGDYLFRGYFANQNLRYEDVRGVPVTTLPKMWELFGQGELDLIFSIINGAVTKELEVKIGGVHYLPVDDSPAAVQRMQKYLPGSYVTTDKHLTTGNMVKNIAYDFVVFTSTKVSDETVYKVVKAVYEGRNELKSYNSELLPKLVAKTEVEYHPGAIKFFTEAGLWPPKG
jgi:TRAP transporter TAXI family solute receptor